MDSVWNNDGFPPAPGMIFLTEQTGSEQNLSIAG